MGFTPKILAEAKNELAKPLALLFRKSLATGTLPNDWKEAHVTPIHKKGCKHDPGNYRPVSLTSVVCKLMESLLRDPIMSHMKHNRLFSNSQHGFRSGRSTVTQLLESLESWTKMLDEVDTKSIDIVYCDFQKAFDSVPHRRLLDKVKIFGITSNIHKWIETFLTGRRQKVRADEVLSRWCGVTSGIPQGSVLGPILFVLFINDLPDVVNCGVEIYADDTKIFAKATNKSEHDLLQENLDKMYRWSEIWQLTFHPEKCHVMHISGGSRGGGPGGPDPPPFGPQCRLFNIGPQSWTPPPFVNVQEWGCFSIFLMADDVTQTMSKGGVLVNVQEWGCFSNFLRSDDVTRTMSKGGVLVKNPVSAPGPPPFQKSWIRACT